MLQDVMIAPSILSADFAQLGAEVEAIQAGDYVHVDIMDGHFVPNLTFGPAVVKSVAEHSKIPLDIHLMIENPDEDAFAYAVEGAGIVSFHWEAAKHHHRLVQALHDKGVRVGIALNPATPVSVLEDIISDLDMVLVMSVNPGFGGQKYIENSLRKYKQVHALAAEHNTSVLVETDGGVNLDNAARIAEAGADLLVAGNAVFKCADRAAAIEDLRAAARTGVVRSA